MLGQQSFKASFIVSRATFVYILTKARSRIDKCYLNEDPVPTELRLAVSSYSIGRDHHLHTISELVPQEMSTIFSIDYEVSTSIVEVSW